MKLLKLIYKKIIFFIQGVMWRSGLFYHDCTKNKVKITDHPQFTWYCKKCNEPW